VAAELEAAHAQRRGSARSRSRLPRWAAAAQIARAMLAGLRGQQATAEGLAAEAERPLLPMATSFLLALVQLARGLAALGSGRYDDAYIKLRRIFDSVDVAYHPVVRGWAIGDLAEAAAHSGHQAVAQAVLRSSSRWQRGPSATVARGPGLRPATAGRRPGRRAAV
jgi:hypothetical protein